MPTKKEETSMVPSTKKEIKEHKGVVKKVKDTNELFLFKCQAIKKRGFNKGKVCGNAHFRHGGYVEMLIPFARAGKKKLAKDSFPVLICTKCKTPYIYYLLNSNHYVIRD